MVTYPRGLSQVTRVNNGRRACYIKWKFPSFQQASVQVNDLLDFFRKMSISLVVDFET